jgi:hypothetical protein
MADQTWNPEPWDYLRHSNVPFVLMGKWQKMFFCLQKIVFYNQLKSFHFSNNGKVITLSNGKS